VVSVDYTRINDAINDTTTSPSWALQGTYAGDPSRAAPRKFLAYALGDGHTGPGTALEVVLAYQYEGYHTNSDPAKNWRCFQVDRFVGSAGSKLAKIPFAPASPITPPPHLTAAQLARQNCVARGIMGPILARVVDYHA
jgi:hypothetical protein